MEIQREIFTLRGGERKTVKTTGLFNCLRFTAYTDLAQTPNTDTFFACKFDLKSESFTGNVYDLFLLNCLERCHYDKNVSNCSRFFRSLYSYCNALSPDDNDNFKHYLLKFEVYFTPQNSIDIGLFFNGLNRFKDVQIECLYTDVDFNLCHSWKHLLNVISHQNLDFHQTFEKTFALLPSEPLKYISYLSQKCKIVTNSYSVDMSMLYDGSIEFVSIFGSYAMTLPAIWLDSVKDLSIIDCNMGNSQKSLNIFYY